VTEAPLPFWTRLWLAWLCFFRLLSDGRFAARVAELRREYLALPPEDSDRALNVAEAPPVQAPEPRATDGAALHEVAPEGALLLLALLQREGRFVDFVQQDIGAFGDAEVGAVARVVHAGCRKALAEHARIQPVRAEPEGSSVSLEADYDPAAVKLTGNLAGTGPYRGVLRHRGWQAETISLPELVERKAARVLAPAEIEL
jgi:hypothetical protein